MFRKRAFLLLRALPIVGPLVLIGCTGGGSTSDTKSAQTRNSDGATGAEASGQKVPENWADVVDRVRKSVVRIETETCDGLSTVGSGFVIGNRIVTNQHVVDGSRTVNVITADGRSFPVDGIRTSPTDDLAVFAAPTQIPELLWHNPGPRIADEVAALGFPKGIGFSFSKGSISALDVTIDDVNGLIQTDAAVNPGNSGGPLITDDGTVVGVVVLKITDGEGLAFAIDGRRAQMFLSGESGRFLPTCPVAPPLDASGQEVFEGDEGDAAPDSGSTEGAPNPTPGSPADSLPSNAANSPTGTEGPAGQAVIDFYDALNNRDYRTAWRLGGSNLGDDPTFSKFVRGYKDTMSVRAEIVSESGENVVSRITAIERSASGDVRSIYENTYVVLNGIIQSGKAKLVERSAANAADPSTSANPADWPDCWLVQVASTNSLSGATTWADAALEVFDTKDLYVVGPEEWPEKLTGENVLVVLAAPNKDSANWLLELGKVADAGSLIRHPPTSVCQSMQTLKDVLT